MFWMFHLHCLWRVTGRILSIWLPELITRANLANISIWGSPASTCHPGHVGTRLAEQGQPVSSLLGREIHEHLHPLLLCPHAYPSRMGNWTTSKNKPFLETQTENGKMQCSKYQQSWPKRFLSFKSSQAQHNPTSVGTPIPTSPQMCIS